MTTESAALCYVTVKNDSPAKFIGESEHKLVRYDDFVENLFKKDDNIGMMKLHAAIGVGGEAGELMDAIKKEVIYNRPVNRENLVEELGDIRFYMQAIMNLYGISELEVIAHNGAKLGKRYKGLQYSDAAANARADKVAPGLEHY